MELNGFCVEICQRLNCVEYRNSMNSGENIVEIEKNPSKRLTINFCQIEGGAGAGMALKARPSMRDVMETLARQRRRQWDPWALSLSF